MAAHDIDHASTHTDGSDDIQDATASVKGLATATQITKLDGIDAGADVTGSNAPQAHAASHASAGGDAIKLDDLAAPDDTTDLNATTSLHGLLPKLGGGTTNYLRADGTWAAPAGGGGGGAYNSTKITTDTTATEGESYTIDSTSAQVTLTLPASPSAGDRIEIYCYSGDNGALIDYNGEPLELAVTTGLTTSLVSDAYVVLAYMDATYGWASINGDQVEVTASSGYISGGNTGAATDKIESFEFTTTGSSTDLGDLSVARQSPSGCSSSIQGYSMGGTTTGGTNIIDRFNFGTANDATDFGDLTQAVDEGSAGMESSTDGYRAGGTVTTGTNVIDWFGFGTATDATDYGDIIENTFALTAASSSTDGYVAGGYTTANTNVIQDISFGSATNSSDFGDLTVARRELVSNQSGTDGFCCGGNSGSVSNVIDTWSFGTSNNATDHGDLTVARRLGAAASGSTDGYVAGGYTTAAVNVIDTYSYSTPSNATDYGDLTAVTIKSAGFQG